MRDSRGQMLLVAAVVIAVVIVGVVVFLNSVQSTQNLGSGDSAVLATNAEATQRAIQEDVRRLLWQVDADGPYARNPGDLQPALDRYSAVSAKMMGASETTITRLTIERTEQGDAASQETEQSFATRRDGSTDPDRVIAENVDSVAAIRMNVTQGRSQGAPFTLNVSSRGSGTEHWFLRVTEHGVEVESDGTTRQLCGPGEIKGSEAIIVDIQGQHGQIRTTNETIDCATFDVAPAIEPEYDVVFNNSNNARGTYNVTVTASPGWGVIASAVPDSDRRVVVNPAYRLVYERADVSYETVFYTYNTTAP